MVDPLRSVAQQTERQVAHWALAASRLVLDDVAAPQAWGELERYLGLAVRKHLQGVIDRLAGEARHLVALQRSARDSATLLRVHRQLLVFRAQYARAETTLDFFADAINSRTNARVGALLRACDTLAYRSMAQLLDSLGKTTPVVLTYLDRGTGASILKAGLRLWDGGDVCPVACVKIVWHNLLRPTALVHEAGHQMAHITGWNAELTALLHRELGPGSCAALWASWASEIAADAFAFVTTGFASVAALHDVVSGDPESVFRFTPGDPHPVSYLRVLLGVEMCRHFYGRGPWDDLALAWAALHSPKHATEEARALVRTGLPALRRVVELVLDSPMRAFDGQPLARIIRPDRVNPEALHELEARIGPALFSSAHWLWTEPLRIVALTGLKAAERPDALREILQTHERAMLLLGGAQQAA